MKLFHHVSYLIWTSDTLIGSMSAVLMLKQEKSLAAYLDIDWASVDESRLFALKRASWAWIGIQHYTNEFESYSTYLDRRTGACGGMTDAVPVQTLLTDYLRPKWIGETDHSIWLDEQEKRLTAVMEKCGHPQMKALLAPIESPKMVGHVAPNPARIPFLRRLVALTLVSVARPNFFKMYEENPREPASK